MQLSNSEKADIKKRIVDYLCQRDEIEKVIIFGSFLKEEDPNDIDIAIFQNSNESYLELSLKYRRIMRDISRKIPLDIIPLISGKANHFIETEIENGETIYEKRH